MMCVCVCDFCSLVSRDGKHKSGTKTKLFQDHLLPDSERWPAKRVLHHPHDHHVCWKHQPGLTRSRTGTHPGKLNLKNVLRCLGSLNRKHECNRNFCTKIKVLKLKKNLFYFIFDYQYSVKLPPWNGEIFYNHFCMQSRKIVIKGTINYFSRLNIRLLVSYICCRVSECTRTVNFHQLLLFLGYIGGIFNLYVNWVHFYSLSHIILKSVSYYQEVSLESMN